MIAKISVHCDRLGFVILPRIHAQWALKIISLLVENVSPCFDVLKKLQPQNERFTRLGALFAGTGKDALSWTLVRGELGRGIFRHLNVPTQGGATGASFKRVFLILFQCLETNHLKRGVRFATCWCLSV